MEHVWKELCGMLNGEVQGVGTVGPLRGTNIEREQRCRPFVCALLSP